MSTPPSSEELSFATERWYPLPPERVWEQCTTAHGLESWWSPEDLRTTVTRLEARPGGAVSLTLRYVPAMLGPRSEEAFRAAGIPLTLTLRGRWQEFERPRRLVLDLTLTLDRAGAGVDSVTTLEFEPEAGGTRVRLVSSGKSTPHWAALGKANLEGQLDRLGRSLGAAPT